MLISKKDLLDQTGISYGQLYRWKREKLIPEEWFIKRSSFTGQETFFPKTKILARIKAIKELKDKYSLEELARILSPEVSERLFSEKDLRLITEISPNLIPCFLKNFQKQNFTYIDVLFLYAISSFYARHNLQLSDVENICCGIKESLCAIKQTEYLCILLEYADSYFITIKEEKAAVYLDARFKTIDEIRLNDLSAAIKVKYKNKFNFRFDEEPQENIEESKIKEAFT